MLNQLTEKYPRLILVTENSTADVDLLNRKRDVPDRRKLLSKLFTLAGLGITAALVSQKETLLPTVQAADGSNLVIGQANFGTSGGNTTELFAGVSGGPGLMVYTSEPNTVGNGGAIDAEATDTTNRTSAIYAWNHSTSTSGGANGLWGQTESPAGAGGFFLNNATTGAGVGLRGQNNSTSAGTSAETAPSGVKGIVNSTSPGAYSSGVLGVNNSTTGNGIGVSGVQHAGGWGVYGTTSSGIGVYAEAGGTSATPLVTNVFSGQTANMQEWRSNGSAVSVVDPSGNFGIGTPSPTVRLDVAGEAHATDFVATSDMRFKEEVAPIDGALDKVLRLQGVYFKWNRTYRDVLKRSDTSRRRVGVIAQQVREVLPEVVSEWGDRNGGGYLAVDCGRLTAVTIEAIKEQQRQIEQLRERISTLEGYVKRLTSN